MSSGKGTKARACRKPIAVQSVSGDLLRVEIAISQAINPAGRTGRGLSGRYVAIDAAGAHSEFDEVLNGHFGVFRHDLPGHKIIPIFELFLGASGDDRLRARSADMR